MKKLINIIELFSGIGGFSLGLKRAGFEFKNHYFSEIEKKPIANYKYNFPNAKSIGTVTDVRGREYQDIDIITFGSPCQDFSMAGKRDGLDGQRSSLIREAIRVVDEVRPSIFVWENVKGTFSSNGGADFWAIIRAFTNIGSYRLEWQLLNTSWILPQNRERIYLIGHLAGRSEPRVFPFSKNDQLFDQKTKSEKGQLQTNNYSTTITDKTGNRADSTYISVPNKSETLTAGGNSGGLHSDTKRGRVGKKKAQTIDTNCCQGVLTETNIRRLTEIETERLQGFPDNWTRYGNFDGKIKEISKTQRYKMTGNAVTVDIVEMIGSRLLDIS